MINNKSSNLKMEKENMTSNAPANRFRPGSKRHTIVQVMNANADRPMDEVLDLIVKATGCEPRLAKHDYTWMTREGIALGNVPASTRKAKAKVAKAPKAPKAAKPAKVKLEKSVRSINAAHKAKVELNVDEIAKIKEANLARMKEVSAKLKPKGKVRDFTGRTADSANDGEGVVDFDPTLAHEEIQSILRDERLIDVCPKFVREDA